MNPARDEQLRQERETFELNKRQATQWFGLRLRMGYCGLAMLVILAALCSLIIVSHDAYSGNVVGWATTALASDILALLVTTWKLVLSPASVLQLSPVTRSKRSEVETRSQFRT
jgi:hypothetical protein